MLRITAVSAFLCLGLIQRLQAQQVAVVTDTDRKARVERLERMAAEQGQYLKELKVRTERVTTPVPEGQRVAEIRKIVGELMQEASFREGLYPSALTSGYDRNRGFYIDSADEHFSLNTKGYMQIRYDGYSRQHDNPNRQGLQRRDDVNAFEVERLFLVFYGYIESPKVMYRILVDGGTTGIASTGIGGPVTTEDGRWFTYQAQIDYEYYKDQYLSTGLFQPPFGVQWMTSAALLQMIDRSMASYAFGFDRALGMMLHGNLFDHRMTYFTAVTNGVLNPDDSPSNNQLDTNFAYYARMAYYLFGRGNSLAELRSGYPESDLAFHKDPEWRLGTSFLYNDDNGDAGTGGPPPLFSYIPEKIRSGRGLGGSELISSVGTDYYSFEVDSAFKYRGFSVNVDYFLRVVESDSDYSPWYRRTGLSGPVHQEGGSVQIGYFIVPKKFEICGRVGGIWDNGGDNSWEYGVGCNYFPFGSYTLRIAADIIRVDEVVAGASSSPNYGLNDELTMFRMIVQAGF
jgi:hypothetical protein